MAEAIRARERDSRDCALFEQGVPQYSEQLHPRRNTNSDMSDQYPATRQESELRDPLELVERLLRPELRESTNSPSPEPGSPTANNEIERSRVVERNKNNVYILNQENLNCKKRIKDRKADIKSHKAEIDREQESIKERSRSIRRILEETAELERAAGRTQNG